MNFHIVTIFPEMFDSYFNESHLGRAQGENKVNIKIYNLRDYAEQDDKRRTVDDTPCGGGPGMVMKVEPIFRCVEEIRDQIKELAEKPPKFFHKLKNLTPFKKGVSKRHVLVLLTSAKGKIYNQQKAESIKNDYTDVIVICGRYEGVDERVAEFIADEEISIGKYILTGGELPAMVIVDSVTRLMAGVLGNEESLVSESYNTERTENKNSDQFDYPVYTRPTEFNGWKVPDVLLGGNHKKIEEWRDEKSSIKS
jgi:tRNA (guanine37-N1)-methyltransferase